MKDKIIVRCYAEGTTDHWEAFCLNFDLAVQGKSFDEVYRELNEMIQSYLETVSTYPAEDRRRLLNRRVPFAMRAKVMAMYIWAFVFGEKSDKERHNYMSPTVCAA